MHARFSLCMFCLLLPTFTVALPLSQPDALALPLFKRTLPPPRPPRTLQFATAPSPSLPDFHTAYDDCWFDTLAACTPFLARVHPQSFTSTSQQPVSSAQWYDTAAASSSGGAYMNINTTLVPPLPPKRKPHTSPSSESAVAAKRKRKKIKPRRAHLKLSKTLEDEAKCPWPINEEAEQAYKLAEELFECQRVCKERMSKVKSELHTEKDDDKPIRFQLKEDERRALGYWGVRMYDALRVRYRSIVSHPHRPKEVEEGEQDDEEEKEYERGANQSEDGEKTPDPPSIKYLREKLNGVIKGELKGNNISMLDMDRLSDFISIARMSRNRGLKVQAFHALQLLQRAQNGIESGWHYSPLMRYAYKSYNPCASIGKVLAMSPYGR